MEYYSAIGKDEYPTFASTWMELEEIMLSEISQAEKRQLSYSFTYLWNTRNSMENIRRRKGKIKVGGTEEGMNHERLWTPGYNSFIKSRPTMQENFVLLTERKKAEFQT